MGLLWRSKAQRTQVAEHSLDDMEGLLNMLMLLSTFMMGFCLQVSSRLDHQGWLEGDERKQMSVPGEPPITVKIMELMNVAITMNVTALAIGVVCYFSMSYSPCREDPAFFQFWFRCFQFPLLVGYVAFFTGMVFFLVGEARVVEMTFPHYCTDNVTAIFDPITGKANDIAGCSTGEKYIHKTLIFQATSPFMFGNIWVFSLVAGFGFLAHTLVKCLHKKAQRTQNPSQEDSAEQQQHFTTDLSMRNFLGELDILHYARGLQESNVSVEILMLNRSEPLLLNEILKESGMKSPGHRMSVIAKLAQSPSQPELSSVRV